MKDAREDAELSDIIGAILRYGVFLSSVVIAVGILLVLGSPPAGAPTSLGAMLGSKFGAPTLDAGQVLAGIRGGSPVSVLEAGMLFLLATPISRVIASSLIFLREKDKAYVGITVTVLAMLLFAIFVIGPYEA